MPWKTAPHSILTHPEDAVKNSTSITLLTYSCVWATFQPWLFDNLIKLYASNMCVIPGGNVHEDESVSLPLEKRLATAHKWDAEALCRENTRTRPSDSCSYDLGTVFGAVLPVHAKASCGMWGLFFRWLRIWKDLLRTVGAVGEELQLANWHQNPTARVSTYETN